MPSTADIAATSIWRFLVSRINAAHAGRKLAVFAGPPGIGKTTAISSVAAENPGRIAVVRVRQNNAKPGMVLHSALRAVRAMSGSLQIAEPGNRSRLERTFDKELMFWREVIQTDAMWEEDHPRLTIVFDEAQTLHEDSIDMLRHWNDGSEEMHGVGIVFVGNHDFRIDGDDKGPSFLKPAVRSRASFMRSFSYSDLTDDDLTLIADAKADFAPDGMKAFLAYARRRHTNRDLRPLTRDLDDLAADAEGGTITDATVRTFFNLGTLDA